MTEAISEAITGITDGHGGPFGSVVVKDGTIVGRGHNQVLLNKDPTAHGEICAIRDACANLNTYDLTGCVLYTTGEPCPMCLFACLWAKIDSVYFGCTIEDNSRIGFRDAELDSLGIHRDAIKDFLIPLDREACLKLFDLYSTLEHTIY
ncbi:MAG: nucleoside deaminase [Clostridia bacterium]|nr:nucleoside deaminase [Clostridia bacterium]